MEILIGILVLWLAAMCVVSLGIVVLYMTEVYKPTKRLLRKPMMFAVLTILLAIAAIQVLVRIPTH